LDKHVLVPARASVLQAFAKTTGKAEVAFDAGRDILAPALVVGSRLCLAIDGDAEGLGFIVVLSLAPPVPGETPVIKIP
jgi:hypothetical protein